MTRMGADIKVESNIAIINGVKGYTGARVSAPDLRAGAALVIAGLSAEGVTIVDDIHYIQRGYEAFEEKLEGLGAQIQRVSSEKEIQNQPVAQNHQKGNHCRNQSIHPEKLLCGAAGLLLPGRPDKLAGHHCPSGSQSRQYADYKVIEHVHQRYSGYSGLAHGRDHHGICHAHRDSQSLFQNQRNNQLL